MRPYQTTVLPEGLRPEDLPEWMRSSQRRTDFLWLSVLLLAVFLNAPLLIREGLPPTPETHQQIVRAIEMSRSLQAGVIYPRWAADFNYGYGSPLWNYLPPLPHWLAGFYHALAQSDPATAVKAVIVLATLLGVMGSFSFARRRWGIYAGILAALSYGLSPSVAWDVPLSGGGAGPLLATGIFLSALWSYDALMTTGHRRDLGVATLLTAALWLAHAPLNFLLALALIGWIAWSVWTGAVAASSAHRAVLAWLTGLLLSAFYLVPAVWESDLIHWQAATTWPLADWRPLSFAKLLAFPRRTDLSMANPADSHAIGIALWGLAAISLSACLYQDWRRTPGPTGGLSRGEIWQARLAAMPRHMPVAHREMFYFVLIGLLAIVLCTPVGSPFWARIPPWLSAYPRDLMPVIACMLALTVAQVGRLLQHTHRWRAGFTGLVLCGMLVLANALPGRVVPQWPEAHTATGPEDILRDEGRGYLAGSFVDGWLIPSHITAIPQPSPSLLASFQSGFIDRVVRERLPAATQADIIESGPQAQRLVINARRPAVLVLALLHFPGWQAFVDDREVPLQRDPQTGFVSLNVPAGRHEVRIEFGSTPARDVGWILSALALLSLAGVTLWRSPVSRQPEPAICQTLAESERSVHIGMLCGFAVAVALVTALPVLSSGWLAQESPPGIVNGATSFPRAFQGGVDLLAFELETAQILRPGDEIALHLFWRAVQPDLPDYQSTIELISEEGENVRVWLQVQHRHPGGIPTSRWPWWPLLRTYVRDSYFLRLPQELPEGTYRIVVELQACNLASIAPCPTAAPLFVYDGRGSSLGTQVFLPVTLRVLSG